MDGRGEGDSRVRCFAVECRDGGGGGCKASLDEVDVVSVDKERKGVRADAIRRRGVRVTVDNMLKGEFKDDKRRLMSAGNPGSGTAGIHTIFLSSTFSSKTLHPQSTFAPVPYPIHRRQRRADPTRALRGERQVRCFLLRASNAKTTNSPTSLDDRLDAP